MKGKRPRHRDANGAPGHRGAGDRTRGALPSWPPGRDVTGGRKRGQAWGLEPRHLLTDTPPATIGQGPVERVVSHVVGPGRSEHPLLIGCPAHQLLKLALQTAAAEVAVPDGVGTE